MEKYVNKTYKELITICKQNNIKGYSKKKKNEIIQLLINKVHIDNTLQNITIHSYTPIKYRVISLFTGMGGMDIGFAEQVVVHKNSIKENNYIEQNASIPDFVNLKRLPYDIVFQNDILPEAKKIAELNNWNHDFHLKDIHELLNENFNFPDAEVIIGGFPCFTKDTLVLTNNGYKPIQDVSQHESLLTHTGQFQKIVNIQQKLYSGTLYDLKIKYHPEIISCTKEHPFYVREKKKIWNNDLRKYEYLFSHPKWKNASELSLNDYYGMVINSNNIIPQFTFQKKINKTTITDEVIILDKPEQWFMIGYFIGDGWIEETKKKDGRNTHKIRFAFHKNDTDIITKIQLTLPITDKNSGTGNSVKYGCADFKWFNILQQFGKYAHGKLIPEWVQDAPKHLIQEFINGYRSADGCILKNGCNSFTTVSYNLAYGIQRLYLKLGYLVSVTKTIRPKTYVIEGRTVNQRDTYQIRFHTNNQNKYSSFIEGEYVWCKPFTITTREIHDETVYNFEVEIDNSYIVHNTIVHNCQDFSHSGKRKGFESNRGTLYQSYVEVVKRVKPFIFVAENVNGLLTMPGEPIKQIIDDFSKVGYIVKYQLIKCEEFGIPQTRWRVIIIGVRSDKQHKLTENWNIIDENKVRCTIGCYFKHLQEPDISNDPAQTVYSKAARLKKGQGQKEVCLDEFAPTIRAEHHGNIEFRRITNGKNKEVNMHERRLSVREAALIQTFSPTCILTEHNKINSKAYRPIGNAVPPLLGYIIGRKVENILNNIKD
jgi:DNA-cytosine methyltransferase